MYIDASDLYRFTVVTPRFHLVFLHYLSFCIPNRTCAFLHYVNSQFIVTSKLYVKLSIMNPWTPDDHERLQKVINIMLCMQRGLYTHIVVCPGWLLSSILGTGNSCKNLRKLSLQPSVNSQPIGTWMESIWFDGWDANWMRMLILTPGSTSIDHSWEILERKATGRRGHQIDQRLPFSGCVMEWERSAFLSHLEWNLPIIWTSILRVILQLPANLDVKCTFLETNIAQQVAVVLFRAIRHDLFPDQKVSGYLQVAKEIRETVHSKIDELEFVRVCGSTTFRNSGTVYVANIKLIGAWSA